MDSAVALVREVGDILELDIPEVGSVVELVCAGANPRALELSLNPGGSARGALRVVRWYDDAAAATRMIEALCGPPIASLLASTEELSLVRGVGVAVHGERSPTARLYLLNPAGDSRPLLRWIDRTAIAEPTRDLLARVGGDSHYVGYGLEVTTTFSGVGEVLRRTAYANIDEPAAALALMEIAAVPDEPVARSFFVDVLELDRAASYCRPLLVGHSVGGARADYKFYYNARADRDRASDVDLLKRLDIDASISLAWAEVRNRLSDPQLPANLVSTIGLRVAERCELTVYLWGAATERETKRPDLASEVGPGRSPSSSRSTRS